jgi:hypothetical protein
MRRRGEHASTSLAALLAAGDDPHGAGAEGTRLVFEAGDDLYAIDASAVEIVVGSRFVAPVPAGPRELLGVVSVHGRMRLAVDVARAAPRPQGSKWWLVVLHGEAQLAVVADRIVGLYETSGGGGDVREHARSSPPGGREARLLDPDRLLEI